MTFPAGYGLTKTALAASGDITVGALSKVLAINGTPGNITNSGSGLTTIATGTSGGNVASVGSIVLVPIGVSVTSAKSAGLVSVGLGDTAGVVAQNATLTPLAHRTVTVPTLAGAPVNVITPLGPSTLSPGRYGNLLVSPGSNVTLTAGTYVVDTFTLSPLGQITLDTSGGATYVYVNLAATWAGTVTGDATRFVFGYLSALPLTLPPSFTGTALAPSALLTLGPTPGTYAGAFYAQHLVVASGATVRQISTPFLAAGLSVSRTTGCPGDPFEVTVDASDAGPSAVVRVNGVVGSHQFLQFGDAAGPRTIVAMVTTPDGRADVVATDVTVQSCAPSPSAPLIAMHFWGAETQAGSAVDLVVHDYDANGHETVAAGPATYAWSFGDGTTATTTAPLVTHDYATAVNHLLPYSYFTASVTKTTATATSNARKVVPIWSLYADNRSRGIVQPPSKVAVSATSLALSVTNYEPTPITIQQAKVESMPCDPNLDARPQTPQPLSVTIAAGATATVNVTPPPAASDVCGVGVHLTGSATAGTVYSDGYARLRENPLLLAKVSDPVLVAYLNKAATMTANPAQFDEFELRRLYAQGLLPQMPLSTPAGSVYANPNVGDSCSPGDTPPLPGAICQPTADWVVDYSEILNASKGNVIMDHGCGPIGQLLSAVGQQFSHTSMVVKNRVEVRHSTASGDRINDSVQYDHARLDPAKVQYGFPGTAGLTQTYTTNQMVNYYCIPDPDGDGGSAGELGDCPPGTWKMSGELSPDPVTCTGQDVTPVPGLVIKAPSDSAPSAFSNLALVSTKTDTVNGHYSFYMYSQAQNIQQGDPSSNWSSGTESTVCSSFDRLAALGAGFQLQPFTPHPGAPDGLRVYTPEERTAAAKALYYLVRDQVEQACSAAAVGGGAGTLATVGGAVGLIGGPAGAAVGATAGAIVGAFTGAVYCVDLEENVANQIVNCFESDRCDDTNNSDWQNPGGGIAVSPDDMRKWDPPAKGGIYGYQEQIFYAPVAFRHAYAWAASAGAGSLNVQVVDNSKTPVQGASIFLNTTPAGTTDSMGKLAIPILAAGSYDVQAQLASPQEFADHQTVVVANQSASVIITLCPGSVLGGGIPTGCVQHCMAQSDCDGGMTCNTTSGNCVPGPRIVHITTPGISIFVSNEGIAPQGSQFPTFDLTCDPTAPGGTGNATYSTCVDDGNGSPNSELDMTFACQQDPSTGGITIQSTAKLQSGCGSGASDRKNTASWTNGIAPPGPSDPNPTSEQDNVRTCYSDIIPPFTPSDTCDDNGAFINVLYTSDPHP